MNLGGKCWYFARIWKLIEVFLQTHPQITLNITILSKQNWSFVRRLKNHSGVNDIPVVVKFIEWFIGCKNIRGWIFLREWAKMSD